MIYLTFLMPYVYKLDHSLFSMEPGAGSACQTYFYN